MLHPTRIKNVRAHTTSSLSHLARTETEQSGGDEILSPKIEYGRENFLSFFLITIFTVVTWH